MASRSCLRVLSETCCTSPRRLRRHTISSSNVCSVGWTNRCPQGHRTLASVAPIVHERRQDRFQNRRLGNDVSARKTGFRPAEKAAFNAFNFKRSQLLKSGKLFDEEGLSTVEPIFLRDACTCSQCVDSSTRQREFSFADIPTNIKAVLGGRDSSGNWQVTWENDIPGFSDHISTFSPGKVARMTTKTVSESSAKLLTLKRSLWSKDLYSARRQTTPYSRFMSSDRHLADILLALRRDGLAFISDVPSSPDSIASLVQRIGPLRNTFYGPTWDVQAVVDSKNVAYTSKYLGFHMDLLYMREAPRFQFLHCLQNSCLGGESRFVDTFNAIDVLAFEHPYHIQPLQENSIGYHYKNDGHDYHRSRRVLESWTGEAPAMKVTNARVPEVTNKTNLVNWSPQFMSNLALFQSSFQRKAFLRAAKAFSDILERDELVYETKMEEGTCVIFDNQRVAHARNAFDPSNGERWLKGAYMDIDDFDSKLRVMVDEVIAAEREGATSAFNDTEPDINT